MKQSRYCVVTPAKGGYALYNTLTQALAWCDEQTYTAIKEGAAAPSLLVRERLLVPEDLDETIKVHARYLHDIEQNPAFCIMVAPTLDCNFHCPYCYEREVRHAGVMSEQVQHDLVDWIERRMTELDCKELMIGWYGGEPFLALPVIENISALLRERGISFKASAISNCALITEAMAQRIAACNITQISATLDGIGERHDRHRPARSGAPTFDAITHAIGHLTAQGIKVSVLFTEDRTNTDDYENVRDLFKDMPTVQVIASQTFDYRHCLDCVPDFTRETHDLFEDPREFAGKQYDRFLEMSPDANAFAGFLAPIRLYCGRTAESYAVIDERGNIYECDGDIGYPDLMIGTIYDEQAPRHKPYDPFTDPLCENCEYVPICLGNCRWTRDCIGESCSPHKAVMDRILEDWISASPLLEEEDGVCLYRWATEPAWDDPTPFALWML